VADEYIANTFSMCMISSCTAEHTTEFEGHWSNLHRRLDARRSLATAIPLQYSKWPQPVDQQQRARRVGSVQLENAVLLRRFTVSDFVAVHFISTVLPCFGFS